ncbi:MAG: DUF499 domain-containing protein [Candidatus Dadabacteria bacterium]|nr:DUF499 domain-containing protein [Candidatus Dadabacteria bacterium]
MKNNTVKPFHKILEVRPDVQDGTLDQSAYAANLGDVVSDIDKPAAKEYRNPVLFREMTYETEGMRKALDHIRVRLQDGKGNGLRQLETSFGGGKTHAMIAMYHKCKDWDTTPVVIDGQSLRTASTLWGEIERQLDGNIQKMAGQVAPSGDQIYELLHNRKKPILILIDEIFNYVAGAAAIPIGNSDLAAQTIIFMQRLYGQLGSLQNVCLVMSLSKRDDVLGTDTGNRTAKIQNEYYSKLQKIAGRHHQLDTISEDNDISHIIRRRLFSTSEETIQYGAKDTIQWCIEQMVEGESLLGDDIEKYKERFANTYPFTPDVIDTLHKKWASYPTFQRTRGVLRLLSLVVHSLLESKRSWIAPSDIDLSVPEIRQELLKHTGDNTESVISTDIVGNDALSRKADEEIGVRCAASIFMYSFPPRTGRGATYEEVKRSTFTYNITHSFIGDTVGKLLRRCFYLDETDDKMLYFDIKPNINHMIDQAKRNVSDSAVHKEERMRLDGARDGGMFGDIHIWPDETEAYNIPDRPVLQLVICKKDDPEWCAKVVNGTNKSRRIHMNGLIFLLPSNGIMLSDLLRLYLGVEFVKGSLSAEYKASTRSYLNSEIKRAKDGIGDELCKKYSVVYVPAEGGKVRKIRDYMFNPATDSLKSLDSLMWGRLTKEDHVAARMAPDIAARYGKDADGAYESMIRTPGSIIPASFEVVREAFESDEPEVPEPPDPPTHGGSLWGGSPRDEPTQDDITQEPEKTYERVLYTDVVNAARLTGMRWMLRSPQELSLKGFVCNISQRPDGMYDIRVEMGGAVPDSVVSNIRPTNRGKLEKDDGWEE